MMEATSTPTTWPVKIPRPGGELATDARDAYLSILNLQIEWRILDLHSCYGMYYVRPTDGLGGDLDIAYLTCPR
jgi:hypothetical protein